MLCSYLSERGVVVKSYEEWKKAVVHLECAADSQSIEERIAYRDELRVKLDNEEISHEQYAEEKSKGSRDVRSQGTAIFLQHESRRYLVTARHVLFDEKSAQYNHTQGLDGSDSIFNIIFRVPSLDEVLLNQAISENTRTEFLMNLGAGVSWMTPYTFSHPALDLAIISLDQRHNSRFADELIEKGYSPISLEDIAGQPSSEGADICAIGFPSATSLLGKMDLHPAEKNWASEYYSLPISSYGKVSMFHDALHFFWGDISIYPGNSGGPIIEDGKLVGIVSAQSSIWTEEMVNRENGDRYPLMARTRIPFAQVIKSKYIFDLLQKQIEKDSKS